MRLTVPRLPPLAWGVVLVAALLVAAGVLPDGPPRRVPEPVPPPAADRTAPLEVLRAWDRARAAAWREGDVRALGDLYVAGSPAGRADRAMLRAYVDRGLRVTGIRMQVAAVRVVHADHERLVLRATDRLAGARTIGHGVSRTLPRDQWSTRRLVLVRSGERWLMARVMPQASAVPRTASTSGSWNR